MKVISGKTIGELRIRHNHFKGEEITIMSGKANKTKAINYLLDEIRNLYWILGFKG